VSRRDPVVERFVEDIARGELPAGTFLPREVDLADEYGVSRNTVREAMQALRARGLVEIRHGRGTLVLAEEHWNVLAADVLVALVNHGDRTDLLLEALESRRLVEPIVVALAAERAAPAQGEQLRELAAAAGAAGTRRRRAHPDADPLVAAERRFDEAVAGVAGNRFLAGAVGPLQAMFAAARHELAPAAGPEVAGVLSAVGDAIAAGDAAAARAAALARTEALAGWLAGTR